MNAFSPSPSRILTVGHFRRGFCALWAVVIPGVLLAGLPGEVLRAPVSGPSGQPAAWWAVPGRGGGAVGQSLPLPPHLSGPAKVSGRPSIARAVEAGEMGGVVVKTTGEEGKLEATATTARPHLVLQVRHAEGWSPVASRHLSGGAEAEVVFELPEWTRGKTHRVMAFADTGFPAGFTEGERTFPPREGGYGYHPMICGLPVLRGDVLLDAALATTGGNMLFAASTNTAQTRVGVQALTAHAAGDGMVATPAFLEAPVEADIWKIVGTRLFFFNQYRGLQVLDLSNPAAPVKTGALRMSAVGEQLYVVNDKGTLLALVTDVPGVGGVSATEIVMVEVSQKGVPKELSRFRMSGHHEDSRLMGNQLHLVLTQSTQSAGQVALVSVDISKPRAPLIRSNWPVPGWMPKLQAVGGHLLVATTGSANYGGIAPGDASTAHVFRVLKTGATAWVKALPLKGVVLDKFKMSLARGAVVAVTQTRDTHWRLETWVETYPLAGSGAEPLAQVSIPGASGETLHATRFDGTKVYVVTFRQIDPLFVVELADPANPVITGELEVPGWSTYLLPRGDQLLAVGVEAGQATVSLFGVEDPAFPKLLSRVSLGSKEGSSWSSTEANYDEKAVEFLPEAGLLLMPFQKSGYAAETGRFWTERGIQVVLVGRDDLTLSEVIPHEFEARRGSLIRGHFVSISGRELIVVRQGAGKVQPVAQLSLAWQVDEVVPFGDYLMQIEYGSPHAMLRVTTTGNPDGLVEEIDPGPGVIVGVGRRGDELFVAQKISRTEIAEGGGWREVFGLRTWRFDLSSPPMVTERGRVENWKFGDGTVLGGVYAGTKARAVWPFGHLLVWEVKEGEWLSGYRIAPPIQPINTISIMPAFSIGATMLMPVSEWLIEVDPPTPVVPPARGRALAMLWPLSLEGGEMKSMTPVPVLGGDNDRLSGGLEAQNGFVFLGMEMRTPPWVADAEGVVVVPGTAEEKVEAPPEVESFSRIALGYWGYPWTKVWPAMMVVDFTQKTPVAREPVGTPGPLVTVANVGQAGAVVVAVDALKQEVRTLVYDGVACWNYVDAVLSGLAGLLAGEEGTVCRALGDEVAVQGTADARWRLEGYHFGVVPRGYVRGDVWSEAGAMPERLRIREGQVFLSSTTEGNRVIRLAGLGAGARLEHRRTVTMPADDWLLQWEGAVVDRLGAGLWVPWGLYGVGHFRTVPVRTPQVGEGAPPRSISPAPVRLAPGGGMLGAGSWGRGNW